MKIKVLRDYSGKEGLDADKNVFAGSEHHVSRARGAELAANGLAEILSDDDDDAAGPGDPEDAANSEDGGEGAEKIAPIVSNKAAPEPKAKPAASKKPASAPRATKPAA